MIPFPLQAGQIGMTRSTSVSYGNAGSMLILNSVTSVGLVVPTIQNDSLLFAVVMRRSAPVSEPAGWTLVSASGPHTDGTSLTQYTHVYSKRSEASDSGATATFSQASSGRMVGQIFFVSTTNGCPSVVANYEGGADSVVTKTLDFPSHSVAVHGNLVIGVGSFALAQPSPSTTTLTATAGWTSIGPSVGVDNRLGIFYATLVTSTAGTITSSIDGMVATAVTSNSVVVSPPF